MHFWGLIGLVAVNLLHAEDKTAELPDKGSIYSPVGKRDPFRPVGISETGEREVSNVSGLEKYSIDQFQLRGILRGAGKAHAMFEDPDLKVYILTEGDMIGREKATISRIVNSEVILTQRTFNYLGAESLLEKVLSLPKEDEIRTEMGNRRVRDARPPAAAPGAGAGGGMGGGGAMANPPAAGAGVAEAGAGGLAVGGEAAVAAGKLLPQGVQDAVKKSVPQPDMDALMKAATGEGLDAPANK